jgi:hypothetical protein
MRRLLLTGAGFSKNWGGYLAREMWERLVGHRNVRASSDIRRVLLAHISDFEAALTDVRELGATAAGSFEKALLDVFLEQDEAERRNAGEYNSFNAGHFDSFFERFRSADRTGLLFTLNQDVFLERRFRGILVAPGIGPVSFRAGGDPLDETHRRKVQVTNAAPQLAAGELNYIKLHGSFNWKTSKGGQLLVTGGNKESQIGVEFPLLNGYLNAFRAACAEGGAWLVVVGYRFRDSHINQAIADGVRNHDLRLVIVDPAGPEPTFSGLMKERPIRVESVLLQTIWSGVAGSCSIPMGRIFGGYRMFDEIMNYCLGTTEDG